jgi:hypothetical protein
MVAPVVILIVYISFCILVGLCGIHRRMGFTGTFILSIVLTPVLVLIILLITGPSRHIELVHRRKND